MADYAAEDSDVLKYKEAPPVKRRRTQRFQDKKLRPESAVVLSYPSHEYGAPSMQLQSTVATFKLRPMRRDGAVHGNLRLDSQQSKTAVGDHWALLSQEGHPLRNVAGEHERFEPTDVFLRLRPDESRALQAQNSEAELLSVRHWLRIRDSEASNKWLYDMVSALVVIRNGDRTAWRLASVLLEAEHWYEREPQAEIVTLV